MVNRSIKVSDQAFNELTALKIRVANSTGKIPTTGSIIAFALTLADKQYDELLAALAKSGDDE